MPSLKICRTILKEVLRVYILMDAYAILLIFLGIIIVVPPYQEKPTVHCSLLRKCGQHTRKKLCYGFLVLARQRRSILEECRHNCIIQLRQSERNFNCPGRFINEYKHFWTNIGNHKFRQCNAIHEIENKYRRNHLPGKIDHKVKKDIDDEIIEYMKIFGRLAEHSSVYSWGLASQWKVPYRSGYSNMYVRAPWINLFLAKKLYTEFSKEPNIFIESNVETENRIKNFTAHCPHQDEIHECLLCKQRIVQHTIKLHMLKKQNQISKKFENEITNAEIFLSFEEFITLLPILEFAYPYESTEEQPRIFNNFLKEASKYNLIKNANNLHSLSPYDLYKKISKSMDDTYENIVLINQNFSEDSNVCRQSAEKVFNWLSGGRHILTYGSLVNNLFIILKHSERVLSWRNFLSIMIGNQAM